MGAHSRRKGAGGEREVGKLLGFDRNGRNGKHAGDLATPDGYPYGLEVKRRARAFSQLYAALDQAADTFPGKVPVALVRDDRREWLAVVWLGDAPWLKVAPEPLPKSPEDATLTPPES